VSNTEQFPIRQFGYLLSIMVYKVTGENLAGNQSSQTILCVEDNKAYLRLRKAVLEREGYIVLTATTGTEALAILRQEQVCLVLSDHMLRGTSGVALAGRMKKMKPHVPVVLYSGQAPDEMNNVDCFISKGESVANFLSIISSLIKRYCD
jgi:CheY-like chemotaxis protein